MNNYSWLHQKLHHVALSSQYMREITFDVENSLISPNNKNENHVFISGLARSGSTILLNALYKSNEFSSLSYKDMPFVLAPNLWSRLSFHKHSNKLSERAHADGIEISENSPEAFEEIFWMTFYRDSNNKKKFKNYVELINHKYSKKRYLSKNNQNIRRLELISNIFPNSKILIPYRNPIQHAHSLYYQHQKFIEESKKDIFISKYMKWLGHTEFGANYVPIINKNLHYEDDLNINHWLEQWYLIYKNCIQTFKKKRNIHFICYEKLCNSKEYWFDILKIANIMDSYDYEFKESHKDISHVINNNIIKKTLALYKELTCLAS